jgi:hypothetical protein
MSAPAGRTADPADGTKALRVRVRLNVAAKRYSPTISFLVRIWSSADTEVLSVVDWEVFAGPQFILERAIETLLGINSKRLEIEVKQSVVAVPDGRVVF